VGTAITTECMLRDALRVLTQGGHPS